MQLKEKTDSFALESSTSVIAVYYKHMQHWNLQKHWKMGLLALNDGQKAKRLNKLKRALHGTLEISFVGRLLLMSFSNVRLLTQLADFTTKRGFFYEIYKVWPNIWVIKYTWWLSYQGEESIQNFFTTDKSCLEVECIIEDLVL